MWDLWKGNWDYQKQLWADSIVPTENSNNCKPVTLTLENLKILLSDWILDDKEILDIKNKMACISSDTKNELGKFLFFNTNDSKNYKNFRDETMLATSEDQKKQWAISEFQKLWWFWESTTSLNLINIDKTKLLTKYGKNWEMILTRPVLIIPWVKDQYKLNDLEKITWYKLPNKIIIDSSK